MKAFKDIELYEGLQTFFPNMNKARVKLIGLFVASLVKSGCVQLTTLARFFDHSCKKESSFRRLQRFLTHYPIVQGIWAYVYLSILYNETESEKKYEPFILILDRTNWQFGKQNINILMLAVQHDNTACPLLWSMLDKKGNSNQAERVDLLNNYIDLFGYQSVKYLIADREFVGGSWLSDLTEKHIPYIIRIRANSVVTDSKGKKESVMKLAKDLAIGKTKKLRKPRYWQGKWVYLYIMRTQKGYLFLISANNDYNLFEVYKERWQIETLFKSLKTQGFNVEKTRIKDLDKINKLLAVITLAFIWCYKIGHWKSQKKPIRKRKDDVPIYNVFQYGFQHLQEILVNKLKYNGLHDCIQILSCT